MNSTQKNHNGITSITFHHEVEDICMTDRSMLSYESYRNASSMTIIYIDNYVLHGTWPCKETECGDCSNRFLKVSR